jgi:hypothetical protein
MKKKKLNVKLKLNKRNVSELTEALNNNVKGGGTWQSCPPYCNTFYSCGCNPNTNYWDCTLQVQCNG